MKREWWLYGLLTGLLLLVMQVVRYKSIVRDIQLELFGGIIACIFLGLGIWAGRTFMQRRHAYAHTIHKASVETYGLSKRELEVLTLLSQGHSNQEIADMLFVSLNTIKTHLSKIYQKLGVSRRTQALQKALELTSD